jgi:hypothetical protein
MIIISNRHNGPPHSAHGGVAAGQMAALVDAECAVVRFHAPPPLEKALVGIARPLGAVEVLAGSQHVATVRPSPALSIEPFAQLHPMEVETAESTWLDHVDGQHPFPTCFGCGTDRIDGLGLRPGPVQGSSMHATFWTPAVDGPVPPWLVWAALDCPSGAPALAAVAAGTAVMTGQLTVDIRTPLAGNERHQILSRCDEQSGRRFRTHAAVVDEAGRHVAVAEATWIAVPSASIAAS